MMLRIQKQEQVLAWVSNSRRSEANSGGAFRQLQLTLYNRVGGKRSSFLPTFVFCFPSSIEFLHQTYFK